MVTTFACAFAEAVRRCLVICAALAAATACAQSLQFTDATTAAGIGFVHTLNGNERYSRNFGVGAAAADYDRDGRVDVFIPQAFGFPDALYHNDGGVFSEVAAAAGVASLKEARAAIWIDVDNDGWLDLFVANDPDAPAGSNVTDPNTTSNLLYLNNHDGTFSDISAAAGISRMPNPEPTQTTGGLAAADVNNDGFVDVYVSCWQNQNALFINNGDGTFREEGVAAGVHEPGFSWQPMFYDVDRDGWVDLLLNMDFNANRLYVNQHDGRFVDMASAAGFASAFNEMGMTLGDYDNDGEIDVLATNVETPFPNANPLNKWTVLLQNASTPGAPAFVERGLAAGVGRTGWGWGCTFFDADNDGRLDLAATNGFHFPYDSDPSRLFRNIGGGAFSEVSAAAGFTNTAQGRGLIALDYDSDGDLDLLETNYNANAILHRNETPQTGNWMDVELVGSGAGGRYAVGAEVTLMAQGVEHVQLVTAGVSFLSHEPYLQHVGLGAAGGVDFVSVRWPDGARETWSGPFAVNHALRIARGAGILPPGDADADGDTDIDDLTTFVDCMRGPDAGLAPGCGVFNSDHDADIDVLDFARISLARP